MKISREADWHQTHEFNLYMPTVDSATVNRCFYGDDCGKWSHDVPT